MTSTVLLTILHFALQASPPSEVFEKGKTAFDRGEYARTVQLLRPLLYPEPRLRSESELVQAHRMLGFAHLFERDKEAAAHEFRKLLQLRPDYRLDPLLDPPQVVDVFNQVVKQYEKELAELQARRRAAEEEDERRQQAARNVPLVVERTVARNSFAVNFIPFGAGQFQNGQPGKAWAFLASESTLAAVSVGAFVANFATYGARPKIKCSPSAHGETSPGCAEGKVAGSEQENSRLLLRIQLVSGGLFFATAAWGVIDAVLNYQPEVRLDGSPVGRSGLTLAPTLMSNGQVGGALFFRF